MSAEAYVPASSPGAVTCRGCGTAFTTVAWAGLELSTLVDARKLRALVLGWPDDVRVEVRVCSCCRGLIARKRSAVSR